MKTKEKTNPLYKKTIDPNNEPWLTCMEAFYEFIALQNGIKTMIGGLLNG